MLHELNQRNQFLRQCQHRIFKGIGDPLPHKFFLGEVQFQFSVYDIPARADQGCSGGVSLALIQNEGRVHSAADSRGTGELVQRIAVSLLAEVVHQQKRNIQFVGELLQLSYLVVVVGVRGVSSTVSYDLKGVNGDQRRIGMLCYKSF